ncbi:hypothetical protein [Qipengyuania seohaensis]|uniref:hypothetical protein n=1 Tax=Qipengyuania seohaensis TaxID=266951 RepID=UPI0018E28060|nr:hypothetical protein [Qipengyuania seohaensis]
MARLAQRGFTQRYGYIDQDSLAIAANARRDDLLLLGKGPDNRRHQRQQAKRDAVH